MEIHPNRIRPLNAIEPQAGAVLYWMDRDRRLHDNWALFHAQNLANTNKAPLHVLYALAPNFLKSAWRQHDFMIRGLQELEQVAHEKNILFHAVWQDPVEAVLDYIKKEKITHVVTDFSPLKIPRKWRQELSKKLAKEGIRLDEVDAHNVIPCWIASNKQEFAAYTFRPKVNRLRDEYLTDFPTLRKHAYPKTPSKNSSTPHSIDWKKLIQSVEVEKMINAVDWIKPGEKAAHKAMNAFVKERIKNYDEKRNDPNADAQSELSPYLHFGQLSAQRLALEVDRKAPHYSDAFLEELIVRRELSDNYCYYNENYDRFDGFPAWAQETLNKHRNDPRDYLYSHKEFEAAKTHDPLWNAAQMELVTRGKMHGYMRMYWAKKILEWTPNPEEAQKIAINLNDRYELDGRDPNGYVGVAWSIGGVHDRAWTERPVYGKIRYMNFNGCKRKFDVQAYIEKWLGETALD